MKKKSIIKNAVLSLLLIMGLVFSNMPQTPVEAKDSPATTEPIVCEESKEVLELREKNSETFLLPDGSYECVIYPEDKYFRDETGKLELIDNSIVDADYSFNKQQYAFTNAANSNRVFWAKDKPAVLFARDDKRISFSGIGCKNSSAVPGGSQKTEMISGYTLSGSNFLFYEDAYENTDLIYGVGNDCLKEYIILKNPNAPTAFSFTFDAQGYSVKKTEDGTVAFYDKDGNIDFVLGELFAIDAVGVKTKLLEYDIAEGKENKTIVTISISDSYVKAPERVFPIMIDPTVSTMITGESSTQDTYVSSRYPDTNYYLNTYLRTGRDADYYTRRTYIRFSLPTSLNGNIVSSAYLKVHMYSGATPNVRAYRVLGEWQSRTLTWNNKPNYSAELASSAATLTSNNWYQFDISQIVKKWVLGTYPNYGVLLKDQTESGTAQWTTFHSSDAASPNKPELHIIYEARSPIILNRMSSSYAGIENSYASDLQDKMNCYGYALQIYCSSTVGNERDYKQQPGEFIHDNQTREQLDEEIDDVIKNKTIGEAFAYFEEKIYGDFAALGSEFTIEPTTASAAVPAGKRKIALAIRLGEGEGEGGYHFYMRHSNGTWSHKQGNSTISDKSITSHVPITDSNIATVAREHYSNGVRFYLIGKSAVVDYQHKPSIRDTLYSVTDFRDKAGRVLETSRQITSAETPARIDYENDVDCYTLVPASSGQYTFYISGTLLDINMSIHDKCGNTIISDTSSGSPSLTATFLANERYFIRVWRTSEDKGEYTLHYSH